MQPRLGRIDMGTYDRDYMRGEPRPGETGWNGPERILWLFIATSVAVYFLPALTGWGYDNGLRAGRFSTMALSRGEIWTLFTYQFVHGNLLHILMNMVGLYFVGRMVVSQLGATQFALVYLAGGVAGALFESIVNALAGFPTAMVGASASVSALLCVFVTIAPGLLVRVFPFPFTFTLVRLAWGYILINLALGLFSLGSPGGGVAYLAHVGGALYGIIHGKYFRRPIVLPTVRVQRSSGKRGPSAPFRSRPGQPNVIDAEFSSGTSVADYNEVLDKINREGIGSLTPEERRILQRASENLGKRTD